MRGADWSRPQEGEGRGGAESRDLMAGQSASTVDSSAAPGGFAGGHEATCCRMATRGPAPRPHINDKDRDTGATRRPEYSIRPCSDSGETQHKSAWISINGSAI